MIVRNTIILALTALPALAQQPATYNFYAAHPMGDYNRYLVRSRELSNVVKTVIYRVDSAS